MSLYLLHLIWIIPVALFYLMGLLMFIDNRSKQARVRKIHTELYGEGSDEKYHPYLGNVINSCVLCPTCKGFVYVGVWDEHLGKNGGHAHLHYIEPIEEMFEKARKRLDD